MSIKLCLYDNGFTLFFNKKRRLIRLNLLHFLSKRLHPLRAASKKNKKGLASVILATNSPNFELVVFIILIEGGFVNKKLTFFYIFFVFLSILMCKGKIMLLFYIKFLDIFFKLCYNMREGRGYVG